MPFRFASPVYAIVGDTIAGISPVDLAEKVLACGIPLVQLRLKRTASREAVEIAQRLRKLCTQSRATFIVNDRVDIAALVAADGVHLGQEDLPPTVARHILGAKAIIGHSTHDADQLDQSNRDDAVDYIAYGPIFATTNKENPDPTQGLMRLTEVAERRTKPLVAIGGIDRTTIRQVLDAGADTAAIIGAIGNAEDPAAATQDLLRQAGQRGSARAERD